MRLVLPRVIRGNRGDIASRYGIMAALLDRGLEISAVFAHRPEHVPSALRQQVLPYGPLYNLWPGLRGVAALRRADLVVWTGGLDLQDDSSLIKLVHTWVVFLTYRLLGLKIVLALQGAGPLTTRTGRFLAKRVLTLVSGALVRDHGSERLLAELRPEAPVGVAADGIFLNGFPDRQSQSGLSDAAAALVNAGGRPVVGLNVRLWFHFAASLLPYQFSRTRYLKRAEAPMKNLLGSIERLIAHLRERHDARVVLVSMYEPGVEAWEDDLPLLERVKRQFSSDRDVLVCNEDLSIAEVCSMFSRFDLMIGMRLHSALIALRAGVPAIHIAYTLKGKDIYADLGLSEWALAIGEIIDSADPLIALADAILTDPGRFDRVRSSIEPVIASNQQKLFCWLNQVGLS